MKPSFIRFRTRLAQARTPALLAGSALVLSACQHLSPLLPPKAGSAELLLMGEQHDQPDHQRQIEAEVKRLTDQGRLAALVLEMVEDGRDTADVYRISSEDTVRKALDWDDRGWPWASYGPAVMIAVRAGVPVMGGNLPRSQMRAVMADAGLDLQLDEAARNRVATAVDEGHCGLLKAEQLPGMVRIQIARDRRMAEAALRARVKAEAGQVVMLHAGEQHVARDRGVPMHLDQLGMPVGQLHVVAFGEGELPVDERRPSRRVESQDHCAGLGERLSRPSSMAAQAGAPAASQALPAAPSR